MNSEFTYLAFSQVSGLFRVSGFVKMLQPCLVRGGYTSALQVAGGSLGGVALGGPCSITGKSAVYISPRRNFLKSRGQFRRFLGHARASPQQLRISDRGRLGCFHCKWKQPGAVVSVWSSRVGFVLPWREFRQSKSTRNGSFSAPHAPEFELALFPFFV